ncbi:cyclin-dependent kinase-like 4 [Microplitis demolitor]|uniref:cyclin-dependent kinase-like 4 n=1 Tax=Microplitis demolitor TaxID=69319 RepID=UPI0004CD34E7|nr:cyclin-dependent kinase-like 4 [Microplitis demolitor]
MDKYENIEVVGEGSYGIVIKCRHRETGQIVAIKKFLETEEDIHVRKMAFREIRMLKKLRHDNLVNMIEVFRRRKRFYLVFEYLDHTVLDELEASTNGLGPQVSKRYIFQVLRGLNFCHGNHIMHRDVKPENVLVSPNGVIKLCDFGFARIISAPNETCTDYVATRWYRAPELLIGDLKYGKAVDVWAVGCLYAEMVTGDPLFPGNSDVDQLYRITKVLGGLCSKHQLILNKNGAPPKPYRKINLSEESDTRSLKNIFPTWSSVSIDFLSQSLRMDPEIRPSCAQLLQHTLFTQDNFTEKFLMELQINIARENSKNLLHKRFERRFTNNEETPRSYESAGRWQMHLIKEMGCLENTDPLNKESRKQKPKSQPQSLYTSSISFTNSYLNKFDKPKKNFSLPALPYLQPKNHKRDKEQRTQ